MSLLQLRVIDIYKKKEELASSSIRAGMFEFSDLQESCWRKLWPARLELHGVVTQCSNVFSFLHLITESFERY